MINSELIYELRKQIRCLYKNLEEDLTTQINNTIESHSDKIESSYISIKDYSISIIIKENDESELDRLYQDITMILRRFIEENLHSVDFKIDKEVFSEFSTKNLFIDSMRTKRSLEINL